MFRTSIPRPLLALAFCLAAFGSAQAQEIRWRSDYAAALKESETTNRPLFVDFYSSNCFYCRQLDASTFRDATVVSTLNDKFVPLKVDGNQMLWLVQALEIRQYPSTVIAAPDGAIRSTRSGYIDATALAAELQRILDEMPQLARQTP